MAEPMVRFARNPNVSAIIARRMGHAGRRFSRIAGRWYLVIEVITV